uniref:Uncharacterized protein n=1 Tax=Anguilla anguilla TaxID=7936 RepID=A0A0E9XCK2_ANGAN
MGQYWETVVDQVAVKTRSLPQCRKFY